MIAGSVPRIALMAFGGVLADRMQRTRIIKSSLSLRVLLMLALVALLWGGHLNIWTMTAFAFFLYGALDAFFFWPARDALLPSVVSEADLPRANSIMLTTNQIGLVFGPVLGGALLALLDYRGVFICTAVILLQARPA